MSEFKESDDVEISEDFNNEKSYVQIIRIFWKNSKTEFKKTLTSLFKIISQIFKTFYILSKLCKKKLLI